MDRPTSTQYSSSLSTFVKLIRCAEAVSADVHRHLLEYGLTISQFGVLEALYHLGPLCQKDLAQRILKTAGNITTVISNLEKQKLITRSREDHDRRYFQVALTAEGEKLISQIFPEHVKHVADRMALLDPIEQRELASLCRKLGRTNE